MSSNPPLVSIGDIYCTQDQVVTPSGARPIREVTWTFTNQAHTWQTTPTWAVVCAVVGFFLVCFLSLLFLLAKEDKTQGWVQVTVQAPGFTHTTQVPVYDAYAVTDYAARVDYARSLSAGPAA
ncbi:MAG TPA: hypothetical protein VGF21_15020 [Thermoleophilaceae bacterium]